MDIHNYKQEDIVKMAMRYEVLRKFNPKQFLDLYTRNIMNNEKFDDMVDELINEKGN